MTALFVNDSADGDSVQHTIATDITTITATGAPWERVRLVLFVETAASSGVFVAVSDWEMRAPGSKNVEANGAAGIKMFLRLMGDNLTANTPSISANAN